MAILLDAGVWPAIERRVAEWADRAPGIHKRGDAAGKPLRLLDTEENAERLIGMQIQPRLPLLVLGNLKGDRDQGKEILISLEAQAQLPYLEIEVWRDGKIIRHLSSR